MHPLYHVLTVDTCLRKRCMTSSNVTDSCLLTPSRFFISCFRLYRILTWAAVRKIKLFAECFVSKTVVQRPNLNESYILACRLLYLNDKERDNWRKEWNFRILSSGRGWKCQAPDFRPITKQSKTRYHGKSARLNPREEFPLTSLVLCEDLINQITPALAVCTYRSVDNKPREGWYPYSGLVWWLDISHSCTLVHFLYRENAI